MDDLWQRLTEQWKRSGIPLLRGVDSGEIAQFEQAHQVGLPSDLRGYFEAVNGTGQEMDGNLLRFWPLAELKRAEDVLGGGHSDPHAWPDGFVFADFCIDCWVYAVTIVAGSQKCGPVFRVTGGDPPAEQVADSLEHFIEMYLADANKVI